MASFDPSDVKVVGGRVLVIKLLTTITVSNLRSGKLLAEIDVGTRDVTLVENVSMSDDPDLICYVWNFAEEKLLKLTSGIAAFMFRAL